MIVLITIFGLLADFAAGSGQHMHMNHRLINSAGITHSSGSFKGRVEKRSAESNPGFGAPFGRFAGNQRHRNRPFRRVRFRNRPFRRVKF